MTRVEEFVARVARLKSIAEDPTAAEVLNSYNELVIEARQIIETCDPWWNRDVKPGDAS